MSKYTPWFPNDIEPVRDGVYQRKDICGAIGFQKWTGKYWSFWSISADGADLYTLKSRFQDGQWRGLAKATGEAS